MKRLLVLFFLTGTLIGSEVPEIDVGIGPGYQWDYYRSRLRIPETVAISNFFAEKYDPMHSVVIEGFANFSAKALQIQLLGSYGWIVGGTMTPNISLVNPPDFLFFSYRTKPRGELASAYGNAGYRIDLWSNACLRVSLTPVAGYGYDQQWINRKNITPNPSIIFGNIGGGQDEARLFLNYPTDVSRMWRGPFLGISFFVRPVSCFSFDIMYSYHWLTFLETSSYTANGSGFAAGVLTSDLTNSATDMRNVSFDARGHKAWFRARYEFTEHWKLDLFSSFKYYSTHNAQGSMFFTIESNFAGFTQFIDSGRAPYKGRWSSFVIVINPSYAF